MRRAVSGLTGRWSNREDEQEDHAPDGSSSDVPPVPSDLQADIRRVIEPWAETSHRPPFNMSQMVTMVLLLGPPCRKVDIMSRILRCFGHYTNMASAGMIHVQSDRDREKDNSSERNLWDDEAFEKEEDEKEKVYVAQLNQGLEQVPDDPLRDLDFALRHFAAPIEVFRQDDVVYYYVKPGAGRIHLREVLQPATTTAAKAFPFMKLPTELREDIYKMTLHLPPSGVQVRRSPYGSRMYLLSRDYETEDTVDMRSLTPRNELSTFSTAAFLGLLRTCKAIYKEAMPVFYRENNFVFFSLSDLDYGLRTLAPSRRAHMEHISFQWYGPDRHQEPDQAFETLSQMHFLRRLDILVSESGWAVTLAIMSNKPFAVKRIPGFAAMQKIRGLETVNFFGDCDQVRKILEKSMTKPLTKAPQKKRQEALEAPQDAEIGATKEGGQKRKAGQEQEEKLDVNAPRKTRSMARGRKAKSG